MSYNTPVRILQGGSVLEIAAGGTLLVGATSVTGVARGYAYVPTQGSVTVTTGLASVAGFSLTGAGAFGSFTGLNGSVSGGSIVVTGLNGTVAGVGPGSISWTAFSG
jgi:hypothetical protein